MYFTCLIKICDDLVEQTQTLNAHVVPIQLDVEVVEVCYGGKQDTDLSVGLVVQVLEGAEGGQWFIQAPIISTVCLLQYVADSCYHDNKQ